MYKNVSGQKVTMVCVDTSTGKLYAETYSNLTFYVSKDDGAVTALAGTPAAKDATNARGVFDCALTATETNADKLVFTGKSTTTDIDVIPVVIYTTRQVDGLHAADLLTALSAVMFGIARPHVVQYVTLSGTPTGGTFRLIFDGDTTSALAYNASAATVQTALEALSGLASGDVTVTGSAGGPYTVTFGGTLDLSALAIMTATDALTGGTTPSVDIETTTQFLLRDGSTVGFTQTYGAVAGSRTGSIIE